MKDSLTGKRYPCPCCGKLTFSEPLDGTYDICPVCYWEDDPLQNKDDNFAGGANRPSLKEARRNYKTFGAIEKDLVKRVKNP